MTFNRPCLKCGVLIRGGTYCPTHKPVRIDSPERKARKAALYGGDYRRKAKAIKATATHCHLCGKVFDWGDTIEADHVFPGKIDSPLAPSHRACNRRKGNTQPT